MKIDRDPKVSESPAKIDSIHQNDSIVATRACAVATKRKGKMILRTVSTIVIAHTFCASPDTRISYRQCLLIQGYLRDLKLSGESRS